MNYVEYTLNGKRYIKYFETTELATTFGLCLQIAGIMTTQGKKAKI